MMTSGIPNSMAQFYCNILVSDELVISSSVAPVFCPDTDWPTKASLSMVLNLHTASTACKWWKVLLPWREAPYQHVFHTPEKTFHTGGSTRCTEREVKCDPSEPRIEFSVVASSWFWYNHICLKQPNFGGWLIDWLGKVTRPVSTQCRLSEMPVFWRSKSVVLRPMMIR